MTTSPSLSRNPALDAWLAVCGDRTILIRTGKVELGQGILTALAMIAAEELDVALERIRVLPADTSNSPDEGYTAGSLSVEHGGMAVRQACAAARSALLNKAAAVLGAPVAELSVNDGVVRFEGANATTDYWALQADQPFGVNVDPTVPTKPARVRRPPGPTVVRRDLAAVIEASPGGRFVHDMTAPDMLHARVVRGPQQRGRLLNAAAVADAAAGLHGATAWMVDGSFVAVSAAREEVADGAAATLARVCKWSSQSRPDVPGDPRHLLAARETFVFRLTRPADGGPPAPVAVEADTRPGVESDGVESDTQPGEVESDTQSGEVEVEADTQPGEVAVEADAVEADTQPGEVAVETDAVETDTQPDADADAEWIQADYTRPFVMHGSIGPSAAAAEWSQGRLHVWSHAQGPAVLARVLADVFDLPEGDVRVTHVRGSGCYGHNGADDVALDAALVARKTPGRRVLVKWTRAQEHGFEPLGSMMHVALRARLEHGRIRAWRHDVRSFSHVARPFPGGGGVALLAAWQIDPPRSRPPERPVLAPEVGVHRNAWPLYDFPDPDVVKRFCAPAPLRTSALRGLGAHANVFAIESFMDELAVTVGVDPVTFRLRHLSESRARAVLAGVAELVRAGLGRAPKVGDGIGVGLARYKNSAAWAAVCVAVNVDPDTAAVAVTHVWICADAGEVIDADGLVNQLEGGAIQALSWTLKEAVLFQGDEVTSLDWDSYPILRFSEVPDVTTRLIDQPGQSPLGAGEATMGPTAAAVANAVADATGLRVRDMPLTPDALRAAAAS